MSRANHHAMIPFAVPKANGPKPERPVPRQGVHVVNIKPDLEGYSAQQDSGNLLVYPNAPTNVPTDPQDTLTGSEQADQRKYLAPRPYEFVAARILTQEEFSQRAGAFMTNSQDSNIPVIGTPALFRKRTEKEPFEVTKARFLLQYSFFGMVLPPGNDGDRNQLSTAQVSGTFNKKNESHLPYPIGTLLRLSMASNDQLPQGCGDEDAQQYRTRPHFIAEPVDPIKRDLDFWPAVQAILTQADKWMKRGNMDRLMAAGRWDEDFGFFLAMGGEEELWLSILTIDGTDMTKADYPLEYCRAVLSWIVNLCNVGSINERQGWINQKKNRTVDENLAFEVGAYDSIGKKIAELLESITQDTNSRYWRTIWQQFHSDLRSTADRHDGTLIGYLAAGGDKGADMDIHSIHS